jgi:hypothetical protein
VASSALSSVRWGAPCARKDTCEACACVQTHRSRELAAESREATLSPKSGVEGRVRIRKKIGGAVQAVGTIRLGARVDAMAARTSGGGYKT